MAPYGSNVRLDAYAWLPLLYGTHVLLGGAGNAIVDTGKTSQDRKSLVTPATPATGAVRVIGAGEVAERARSSV